MLSCLTDVISKIDNLEDDYVEMNFREKGMIGTFMQRMMPLKVQSEVFSAVLHNRRMGKDTQSAMEHCASIYIPTQAEMVAHRDAIEHYIERTQLLLVKFSKDVPIATFMERLTEEAEHIVGHQPLVPFGSAQPIVRMREAKKYQEAGLPSDEAPAVIEYDQRFKKVH